jgi:hypothetical protein
MLDGRVGRTFERFLELAVAVVLGSGARRHMHTGAVAKRTLVRVRTPVGA